MLSYTHTHTLALAHVPTAQTHTHTHSLTIRTEMPNSLMGIFFVFLRSFSARFGSQQKNSHTHTHVCLGCSFIYGTIYFAVGVWRWNLNLKIRKWRSAAAHQPNDERSTKWITERKKEKNNNGETRDTGAKTLLQNESSQFTATTSVSVVRVNETKIIVYKITNEVSAARKRQLSIKTVWHRKMCMCERVAPASWNF